MKTEILMLTSFACGLACYLLRKRIQLLLVVDVMKTKAKHKTEILKLTSFACSLAGLLFVAKAYIIASKHGNEDHLAVCIILSTALLIGSVALLREAGKLN